MAGTNTNVIVGAAAIFVSESHSNDFGIGSKWYNTDGGPHGPALPSLTANKSAEGPLGTSADWRSVGYTTDGVEVSYEPEYGDVVVDQALDAVKIFKQGMRVSVRTTLAEPTLENILLTWGQDPDDTLDKTPVPAQKGVLPEESGTSRLGIAAGALGEDPIERSLAFVGPGPKKFEGTSYSKKERVYHIRRALQVESSAHSLSRQDATTLPVSFRCLPADNAASGHEYGVIYERTVA